MTKDQLEEARKIHMFALASRNLSKEFEAKADDYPCFSRGYQCVNALKIMGDGGNYLPLTSEARPEVFLAWQACQILMQQALDTEARRWAKAFDEFKITE